MFEKMKERREERRLSRMESDLRKLHNRLEFDPMKAVQVDETTQTNEYFTRRIQEFKVLATGNPEMIEDFYEKVNDDNKLNFFWRNAPDNYLKVHAGFPKLIADKMASIIAGKGVDFDLQVYNESNEIDENATKEATATFKALEEKVSLNDAIYQMAFDDAVFGHDIVKLNYDLSISQYPIIEVCDLTRCEVHKVRGVTKEIVFKEWYTYGENKYKFEETYTTNENGFAIIKNALYKMNANGKQEQIPLNSIPDTMDLVNNRVQDETNPLTFIQVFDGLEGMIAFEKPNKLPNTEFNTVYGRSDIAATDLSDKIDEITSEIASEVRNNKTISYIPTSMIQVDENGNRIKWNPFVTRFQKISSSMDQGANNEIKTDYIQDKTAEHCEKAKIYMDMLCASCGLSPLSLGITSFESVGANVSGDGFRERIKTTIDTRDAKIKRFKPYLANMARQLLAFDYWLVTKAGAKQFGLNVQDINFDNTDIQVDFGEYVGSTEAEIYSRVQTAYQSGVMSLEQTIDELHPEWTEEQKTLEINRIKVEKNMAMDTPELLQFEDLTGGTNGTNS